MNLLKPKGIVTQGFGDNANSWYKNHGLAGHTGIDYYLGHGRPRIATETGHIYKILNKGNSDLGMYRAVCQIIDLNKGTFEVTYGHLNDIVVSADDMVAKGEMIGTEGNTGEVWAGGVKVTNEMKQNGSEKGAHLHFQVRKVKRTKFLEPGEHYLKLFGTVPYMDNNGFYYQVVYRDNGYNGCVDPSPFFYKPTTEGWLNIFWAILRNIKKKIFK